MRINITTVPHAQQRYETVGDWSFADDFSELRITVSETGNPFLNFLVARHELDEAMLCWHRGVTQKQVDDYDMHRHNPTGGDSFTENPDSPYYVSHCDALASEWQMARLLGIDWRTYGAVLESLDYRKVESTAKVKAKP